MNLKSLAHLTAIMMLPAMTDVNGFYNFQNKKPLLVSRNNKKKCKSCKYFDKISKSICTIGEQKWINPQSIACNKYKHK